MKPATVEREDFTLSPQGREPLPNAVVYPDKGTDGGWRRRQIVAMLALAAPLAACENKKAKRAFEGLASSTHGVAVGNLSSPKTVYAFFDTSCSHCRLVWNMALPVLQQARWVWVPLDSGMPGSRQGAIDCLSSPDPQAWLKAHMAGQPVDAFQERNTDLRELADGYVTNNRSALDPLPEYTGPIPFVIGWHDGDLVILKSGTYMDLRSLGFHA